MNQTMGQVIEVFIPKVYKNKNLLDIMDVNKIGFKIQTKDEVIEVICYQDETNANIYKGDYVLITNEIISGKKHFTIELLEGASYE